MALKPVASLGTGARLPPHDNEFEPAYTVVAPVLPLTRLMELDVLLAPLT
jgi:hypothetical protein